MTDRVYCLTVALAQDIREDDVEPLINAIKRLRGVLNVGMNISNPTNFAAYERARRTLVNKLWKVLSPEIPTIHLDDIQGE